MSGKCGLAIGIVGGLVVAVGLSLSALAQPDQGEVRRAPTPEAHRSASSNNRKYSEVLGLARAQLRQENFEQALRLYDLAIAKSGRSARRRAKAAFEAAMLRILPDQTFRDIEGGRASLVRLLDEMDRDRLWLATHAVLELLSETESIRAEADRLRSDYGKLEEARLREKDESLGRLEEVERAGRRAQEDSRIRIEELEKKLAEKDRALETCRSELEVKKKALEEIKEALAKPRPTGRGRTP